MTIAGILERLAKELGILHGDILVKVVNGKVSLIESYTRADQKILQKDLT